MAAPDQANGHRKRKLETAGSVPGTTCFRRLRQELDTSLSIIQNDLPNRTSTGTLKKPTVIDRGWKNWSLHDLQDQRKIILGGSHALTQRNEARVRAASIGNANL
jgi:hypothetical protein